MPNIRIVNDNALERAVTLSASSSASAATPVGNLVNDWKSSLWRSAAGTTARLEASWTIPEMLGAVGMICNLSPTAQWRVRASGEGSTINYARYSETFDSTFWAREYCTVGTTEAASAGVKTPAGTYPAKFKETSGTAEHYLYQSWSVPVGQQVTLSVMVKAAERGFACLKFDSGANTAIPVGAAGILNLATGVVTPNALNPEIGWQFAAVALSGGWWRFFATCTTTANGTIMGRIGGAINATDMSYTGVAGSGFYVWGAQLEYGPLSSYYPNNTNGPVTRPVGYTDNWQTSLSSYDSGWVLACPAPAARIRRLTAAQAASAYAYGGGAFARLWIPAQLAARSLIVEIDDPGNLQGYIEAPFWIAAPYWEAKKNADYGAEATPVDSTKSARTEAGDLASTQGTRSSKLRFSLTKMDPEDSATLWNILRANGTGQPLWVSLFPEDPDLQLEAIHQIYGKFVEMPSMSRPSFRIASASVTIESV